MPRGAIARQNLDEEWILGRFPAERWLGRIRQDLRALLKKAGGNENHGHRPQYFQSLDDTADGTLKYGSIMGANVCLMARSG